MSGRRTSAGSVSGFRSQRFPISVERAKLTRRRTSPTSKGAAGRSANLSAHPGIGSASGLRPTRADGRSHAHNPADFCQAITNTRSEGGHSAIPRHIELGVE